MFCKNLRRTTAIIFKKKGYKVGFTQTSNDGGIDLTLNKDEENIGVLCKAYNKNVGVAAVRETIGVKAQWPDFNKFMVVSLHGFSKQAIDIAERQDVELFSIRRDHFNIP